MQLDTYLLSTRGREWPDTSVWCPLTGGPATATDPTPIITAPLKPGSKGKSPKGKGMKEWRIYKPGGKLQSNRRNTSTDMLETGSKGPPAHRLAFDKLVLMLQKNPTWYAEKHELTGDIMLGLNDSGGGLVERVESFSFQIKERKEELHFFDLVLGSMCIVLISLGRKEGHDILKQHFSKQGPRTLRGYKAGFKWANKLVDAIFFHGQALYGAVLIKFCKSLY